MPYSLNRAESAQAGARATLFDAEITPHDSLGRDGFALFVKIVLGVAAAVEAALLAHGSWVIGLFLAFDTGLLLVAFLVFRAETNHERIVIADGLVSVTRRDRGRTRQRSLRVFGLALERDDDPDYGCQSLRLRLRAERIEVARDLSPDERARFCARLETALREAGAGAPTSRRVALPLLTERGDAA
jgi:uncharacterized membrane protein